ncbi:uncharacterized protein DSM5745_01814 [Aspergillus mulundensis]|uniref:DUF6594 domain-containing protein n=1 Tax=Aspergillus mulundensis TaxID=1810919 RepID=A0A3D8SUU6_9EURO|nr:hypothetical protein DSM5745_01814 [Aspergillus mulundensis]RDW90039.1 hypothetical protein DSM5745_01814 [Aspergillus mulundensis]
MATRPPSEPLPEPKMALPQGMKENYTMRNLDPTTSPGRSMSHGSSPRQQTRSVTYIRSSARKRQRRYSSGGSSAEQSRKPLAPASAHGWVIEHHQGNLIAKHRKNPSGLSGALSAAAKRRFRGTKPPSAPSLARGTQPDDNVPVSSETPAAEVEARTAAGQEERLEVSFAELQRMRLRKLQSVLVRDVADMYLGQVEPDGWETSLQHELMLIYLLPLAVQAYRDYEYMTQALSTGTEDPFIAHTEDETVLWMLESIHRENERNWPRETKISRDDWAAICRTQDARFQEPSAGGTGAPPIGGTRRAKLRASRLRSTWGRILTAVVGGLFLIGPMWLMVLHNTRYTALVSTSVCVFGFGVLMANALEKPMDVLSSTAAYAAVLVVFVGTNTQSDA